MAADIVPLVLGVFAADSLRVLLVADTTVTALLGADLCDHRRARPNRRASRAALGYLAGLLALAFVDAASAETWRGLTVTPEHRCAPYDKKRNYPYPQSVEHEIVRELGAVYGPYTGTCFASAAETDIEHIVAASEAHDSGLCARVAGTKARFARDLRNLTLASPPVNRHQKSGKDAAEWVPARNRCWFAARVVAVRRAYGLTIDRREADTLDRILAGCESTALEPIVFVAPPAATSVRDRGSGDNACTHEVRRQPQRPDHLRRGSPARDCPGSVFAPGIPVHEGRGRGWRRLRIATSSSAPPSASTASAPRLHMPSLESTAWPGELA